jgi:hypothetical protein
MPEVMAVAIAMADASFPRPGMPEAMAVADAMAYF